MSLSPSLLNLVKQCKREKVMNCNQLRESDEFLRNNKSVALLQLPTQRTKGEKKNMMRRHQDEQSRVFYELSALVLNLLRSPPTPLSSSDHPPPSPARSSPAQISPAGFASLLLGISLALMLCGSVTFFIGFMLMPWVLGLAMVFYLAGIVSTLSLLGRSILSYATAPATPRKDIPEWKVL